MTNRRFLKGLYNLAWLRRDGALSRINWRDMETEEFGSVYESLLELTPVISDGGRVVLVPGRSRRGRRTITRSEGRGKQAKAAKGNERKTTGSYYTPDSLVQLLLKEALDPVIDRKVAENPGNPEALLTLKVIDPACGSGPLPPRRGAQDRPSARRAAARADRRRSASTVTRCATLRGTASMASTATRWRSSSARSRSGSRRSSPASRSASSTPTSAAATRCSASSISKRFAQGIPDEAYKPLTGDDKETAKHFAARNRAEKTGQGALDFGGRDAAACPRRRRSPTPSRALRALPEDSVEEIAEKQRRFAAAEADPGRWRWRVAADLYVAAFLTPKTGGVPANRNTVTIPTTEHVWAQLAGQPVYGPLIGRAQDRGRRGARLSLAARIPGGVRGGRVRRRARQSAVGAHQASGAGILCRRASPRSPTAPNAAARGQLIAKL